MEAAPNCDTIYFEGFVIGQGGAPVPNARVRLRFFDNTTPDLTGGDGKFGFSPYGNYINNPHLFKTPATFLVDIVDIEGNPRSDTHEIHFEDCSVAGQFTNIRFVYQW